MKRFNFKAMGEIPSALLTSAKVLLLASLLSVSLLAQRTTATIFGLVLDTTGAAIPGAHVEIRDELTGAVNKVATDAHGEFTVSFLQVGRYTMTVTGTGFGTVTRKGLNLDAGQQLQLPVTMSLATDNAQVTVTTDTPLVQNGTSTQQDTVSSTQIQEIPQQKRDFTSLLSMQNGVQSIGQGLFQMNGLAAGGISVTVDGVDASGDPETPSTSMFQGFNLINVMSEDAIQEVAVSKGIMSAEVARSFSGNINIISKGGSNQFHGAVFELFQNDVLNARNALLSPTAEKPPVRLNQYGGSLGGPIMRNRLFFFVAYEGLQQRNYSTFNNQIVPTQYFVNRSVAAIPSTATVLSYFPIAAGTTPTSDTGLFSGSGTNTASDNHVDTRFDYHVTDRDILTMRYIHGTPTQLTAKFPTADSRQYVGDSDEASFTFIHSASNWANEARFGYNYSNTRRTDLAFPSGVAMIKINGAFSLSAEYLQLRGHSYTFDDVWEKSFGRHHVKVGGIYVGRAPQRYDNQLPVLSYKSTSDFVANNPNQGAITFGTPSYHGRGWELGGFVQDDFQISPRLLLNLGFRWDYYSVFKTQESNLLFNPTSVAASLARPVTFRPADSIYDTDKTNPEPRVGFVYMLDPQGYTLLRGGVGISVAPYNYREFSVFAYTYPTLPTSLTLSQANLQTYGLKYPLTNTQVAQALTSSGGVVGYPVFDPQARNPYTVQWTLDIQQQINSHSVFKLGYVGNKGLKIFATHNANLPNRLTGASPDPLSLQFQFRSGSDFSWYHAMEASYEARSWHGLQYFINYTFSKSMAEQGGDFWLGDDFKVQDENNLRADIGPTKYNIPNRLVASMLYQMPMRHASGFRGVADTLLFGWKTGLTEVVQSGSPQDIIESSTYPESRVDRTLAYPFSYGKRFVYFNKAAFALVNINSTGAPDRPGNISKNAFRGPAQANLDASLGKSFPIYREFAFTLRAEAFNVLNHVRLGSPVDDLTKSTFGTITSVGDPRTVQLDARFQF